MIQNMPTIEPKAPAMAVFVATTANWMSVEAKVDAALKPNQPNKRMNVPSIAIGMWWPAAPAACRPCRTCRCGSEHDRSRQRRHATDRVDDAGAGEVDVAGAEAHGVPSLASQPPPHVQAPKSG